MGMDIPLTITVKHSIGLSEISPQQAGSIAAVQFTFYSQCLFWLLRNVALTAPHNRILNMELLCLALENLSELGEAINEVTLEHIDNLERMIDEKDKQAKDLFDALDAATAKNKAAKGKVK